jgi:hypothetical protein
MSSCLGCVTATGGAVPPVAGATNEFEVSGAAIKAKRSAAPPYWGFPNSVLRLEPTWGDVDVLNTILSRLLPTNAPQLLAGFSSSYSKAKAIQTIRNGTAHLNAQTLAEVAAFSSAYHAFPIVHPVHALFWTDSGSGDFLVTRAIDDLRHAASAAIT